FVEEEKTRNAAVLELLEDQLQGWHALWVRLAYHDGGIAARKRQGTLKLKFDRTRTIDEGEGITKKGDIRDIDFDAHAVVAGFRGAIADGVAIGDLALARDDAGAGQDRLQQRRLAGKIRSYQCDAAGAAGGRATRLPHRFLLNSSGRTETRSPRASA